MNFTCYCLSILIRLATFNNLQHFIFFVVGLDVEEETLISFQLQDCNCNYTILFKTTRPCIQMVRHRKIKNARLHPGK